MVPTVTNTGLPADLTIKSTGLTARFGTGPETSHAMDSASYNCFTGSGTETDLRSLARAVLGPVNTGFTGSETDLGSAHPSNNTASPAPSPLTGWQQDE